MALLDLLKGIGKTVIEGASGAVSDIGQEIKDQGYFVKPALTMAAAIPAAMLMRSLTPKRARGRAAGDVYKLFGSAALDQLGRPQKERDALINVLAKEGQLLTTPPVAGARPLTRYGGVDIYRDPRTLAQAYPNLFAQFAPQLEAVPPPLPDKFEVAPTQPTYSPRAYTPPETTYTATPQSALDALLFAYGQQPNRRDAIKPLLSVLSKEDARQQEAERYERTLERMEALVGGDTGEKRMRTSAGIGPRGYPSLRIEAVPPRERTPQQKAFEELLTPEEQRAAVLRRGSSGKTPEERALEREAKQEEKRKAAEQKQYNTDVSRIDKAIAAKRKEMDPGIAALFPVYTRMLKEGTPLEDIMARMEVLIAEAGGLETGALGARPAGPGGAETDEAREERLIKLLSGDDKDDTKKHPFYKNPKLGVRALVDLFNLEAERAALLREGTGRPPSARRPKSGPKAAAAPETPTYRYVPGGYQ